MHSIAMLSFVIFLHTYAFSVSAAQHLCGGVRNRYVCDLHNPAIFHICVGSNQYDMVCPGTLHFNEETQQCDWPETANCAQQITSIEPTSTASPARTHRSQHAVSLLSMSTKSTNTASPVRTDKSQHMVSLPATYGIVNFNTKNGTSNRLDTSRRDYNILLSDMKNPEASNTQIRDLHFRHKLKLANNGKKSLHDLVPADKKVHENVKTLTEGLKNISSYLGKLKSVNYKLEPYGIQYHRWLLPYSNRYHQTKSKLKLTSYQNPYRKNTPSYRLSESGNHALAKKLPRVTTLSPKTDDSVDNTANKLYNDGGVSSQPIQHYLTTSEHKSEHRRRLMTSQRNEVSVKKSASPYRRKWKVNDISRSHSDRLQTHMRNRNKSVAWTPFSSESIHTDRKASLDRSSSTQNSQDAQDLKKSKPFGFQHSRKLEDPKTPTKYAAEDSSAKGSLLQPSPKMQSQKIGNSFSHLRKPWWSTLRPRTSELRPTKSINSARKYVHSWYKHKQSKKENAVSTTQANLTTKKLQKLTNRSNKSKYKPRDYISKPSYNIRSAVSLNQAQTGGMSKSDKPVLKHTALSHNSPASIMVKNAHTHNETNSPATTNEINSTTAIGKQFQIHKVNAAASSDNKMSSLKLNDKDIENMVTDTQSEKMVTASKTNESTPSSEIIAYKSPTEKYKIKKSKCSSSWCKLPACRCIGSDIPGGLDAKDIPQMVILTFDDSITGQNINFYRDIFNNALKNPNGCPIKSTFFVSGDHSDYELVKWIYKEGHEIASHTLSHRSPTTWWADAGYDNWEQEVVGMRERLKEKAGVPIKEVTGMRAPFLQVGGDGQYAMLKENQFRYDSSMVTGYLYSNNKPPIWPFTLDTPPDSTTCNISPCPKRSYPGLWEVPLVRWYGTNHIACAMPDACTVDSGIKPSHKFIEENFNRHYTTNRAPFGIFIHAAWFSRSEGSFEGLKIFLSSLAEKEDVWVVTINQALDWIQRPVRLSALNAVDSWAC